MFHLKKPLNILKSQTRHSGPGQMTGKSNITQPKVGIEDIASPNINLKMNKDPLQWYIDLRKDGTFAHAGAGLGFDRLVSICTMVENGNIRDAIPFPVAYKECAY